MKTSSNRYVCDSCLGYGHRIVTEDGRSFNAEAAKANGIQGDHRPCHCQAPKNERECDAERE
jgi:hypothetical protein